MSLETLTIICLSAMNAFQLIYWTWQVHKLVNKLMSRNYAEYNYVTKPPEASPKGDFMVDDIDVLSELNSRIG